MGIYLFIDMVDEVIVYGDKESCEVCEQADKEISERAKKSSTIEYHYKDIQSENGQHFLEGKGVKEGEKINVPYIQACSTDPTTKKKSCATVNEYDPDQWKSLDEGKLPENLNYVESD
jgi:hypothetical protein